MNPRWKANSKIQDTGPKTRRLPLPLDLVKVAATAHRQALKVKVPPPRSSLKQCRILREDRLDREDRLLLTPNPKFQRLATCLPN